MAVVPEAARNHRFSRPDEDERDSAHRSATNDRDEEGDPDLQRVTQERDRERDRERDVICANLGDLDKRSRRDWWRSQNDQHWR
jgi:hypothetical protein